MKSGKITFNITALTDSGEDNFEDLKNMQMRDLLLFVDDENTPRAAEGINYRLCEKFPQRICRCI